MNILKSYQSRLIAIMLMVIALFILILSISNYNAHLIIKNESARYQAQTAQLYKHDLIKIKQDLIEYSRLISEDTRIQQHIYAITQLGVQTSSLDALSSEQLKSSTDHNIIIFSNESDVLYNSSKKNISAELRKLATNNVRSVFYISEGLYFKIISYTPIYFNKEKIGSILVYKDINDLWLNSLPRNLGSDILMVKNNSIIASTLNISDNRFYPENNELYINNDKYRLTPVYLPTSNMSIPQLWLAESDSRLFFSLQQYNDRSFIIIIGSSLFLLILGIAATKKISKTIHNLIDAANEMTQGKKPNIQRSDANTEIDILYNQFADMVDAIHSREAEIEKINKQLRRASITDELTQLYNRRHLAEVFPKLQAQAERSQTNLCAILCDIDFFKRINDSYGHTAGDQCLVYFSNLLRSITRNNDYLFRMGGEEFLVLTLAPSIQDASKLANKICRATASQVIEWEDLFIPMTVSCGISRSNDIHVESEDSDPEHPLSLLVSTADHALYKAKSNGRNQVCIDEASLRARSQLKH